MARVSLISSSGSFSSTLNTLIRLESQPLPLSSAVATAAIAALLNATSDNGASSLNVTLTHMQPDFMSSHVAAGAARCKPCNNHRSSSFTYHSFPLQLGSCKDFFARRTGTLSCRVLCELRCKWRPPPRPPGSTPLLSTSHSVKR